MQLSEYLPDFKHGVFVSYAHLDKDWVDLFVEKLRASLKRLLGLDEKELIWKDDKLRVGDRLTDELADAISNSAVFLVVLSPGWINSDYCQAELAHYESTMKDPERQRVCIVEALPPTEGQELPPGIARHFSNHIHVKFYAIDPDEGLKVFDEPKRKPFARALSGISCSLRDKLTALHQDAPDDDEAEKLPPLLLAEATDDLEEQRGEIRNFLEGAGATVLPSGSYFGRIESFERAFGADAEKAALLVQLLGRYPGRMVPRAEEPLVLLQHRLAAQRRLPMLHWRPPDLDLSGVSAGDMRGLLEAATVRSGTLESFKREILQYLRSVEGGRFSLKSPAAEQKGPPAEEKAEEAPADAEAQSEAEAAPDGGELPFIFVNADRRDWPVAEFLRDELANHVLADTPLDIDDPGQIDQDRSEKIRDCDGMVLVYGATPQRWVNSQLLQFSKLAPRRGGKPKPIWIYEAPPEQKASITLRSPLLSYETVGSRSQLSRESVVKILDRLQG